MKFELNDYKQELSDEEILNDIKETSERFNQDYISISFYKKYGKYSAEHIFHRFKKWNTALELAGLCSTGFSKDKITQHQHAPSLYSFEAR